jgi:hypothetical protein
MIKFIQFFRAIFTLIEVFCFNPPPTIRENQGEYDKDADSDQPLFL